jgi:DNA-directed RNA polymerase specialized sigma24 family protein
MFQSYGIICRKTMGRNKATSRLAPFSEVHPARLQPHLTVLLRFVRAKMRNDPEAEDVVQEIVLKVLTGLRHFRFEASIRT